MTLRRSTSINIGALVVLWIGLICSPANAVVIHDYQLNNSYADALGGPALIPQGGTLNATNYSFTPDKGLKLSNALPSSSVYSIEMNFQLSSPETGDYRKLIDFKNLDGDNGLYARSSLLDFYGASGGSTGPISLTGNTYTQLVVTRDALDNFTAYINGVQQLTFVDDGDVAVFSGLNNIITLFIDDGNDTNDSGAVDYIRIYDTALTSTEVAALAIPEPSTIGFVAVAGVVLIARRRWGTQVVS